MKKSKKRSGSRRNKTPYYTPGRNMFGEVAETHLIVLERETALYQMLDAIRQLDNSRKIEFTFDCRCFEGHWEEYEEICRKAYSFLMKHSNHLNMPVYDAAWLKNSAS